MQEYLLRLPRSINSDIWVSRKRIIAVNGAVKSGFLLIRKYPGSHKSMGYSTGTLFPEKPTFPRFKTSMVLGCYSAIIFRSRNGRPNIVPYRSHGTMSEFHYHEQWDQLCLCTGRFFINLQAIRIRNNCHSCRAQVDAEEGVEESVFC